MICICGHDEDGHRDMMWECTYIYFPFSRKERRECLCFVYRPDNLRYLEQKYEQSNLQG